MGNFVSVKRLWKTHLRHGFLRARAGRFTAVRNVSFGISRNEILGVVGESGCGKTTLAKAMLYLDPPTSGEVRIDGLNPSSLDSAGMRHFRRSAQMVFQDPNSSLDPRLRIRSSIGEALSSRGLRRERWDERIDELLELTGISPAAKDRFPGEFSGGQRQRIVIARALAMEPKFLILDEPVSSLDVSIQAQIINLLLDLKERLHLTYLFISHDLNLISFISDTIAVMKDGEIVEYGAAGRLVRQPEHPYTRTLFSRSPAFHDRRHITRE